MTLPLPNLDDRRWHDLVEEGRALVTRHAPSWSDHNVHDPGITLLELQAWLAETAMYRANRVPDRHRRKFLALVGIEPHAPQPALGALTIEPPPGTDPFSLPAGAEFTNGLASFRTLRDLDVTPNELVVVQTGSETQLTNRTTEWREGLPLPALGADPHPGDALYLGFRELPSIPLALFLHFANPKSGQIERRRLISEVAAQRDACEPILPRIDCGEEQRSPTPICFDAPSPVPPHTSARTVWEIFTGGEQTWIELEAAPWWERPEPGQVLDDTRALTLNGLVEVHAPIEAASTALGDVAEEFFYLRCRLVEGVHDALPTLKQITVNGVLAVESTPVTASLVLAPGLVAAGNPPTPGDLVRFQAEFSEDGTVTALTFLNPEAESPAPPVRVLAWEPAALATPGRLGLDLVLVGRGDGHPDQHLNLPEVPVFAPLNTICEREQPRLFTLEDGTWRAWTQRPDFDASRRTDAHFTLDATSGEIRFGDGEQGRVVPAGAPLLAAWSSTRGAAGNLTAGTALRPVDSLANELALAGIAPDIRELLADITSLPAAASGGADQEALDHAIGRAIEARSSHERLIQLCEENRCRSLDDIERSKVLALTAPERGANLLDLERLAFEVPGSSVARSRALAGFDPVHPCLKAPGTVTVIVVPQHPARRPVPSTGLLRSVRRYLDRRRLVATRLLVVGPDYLEVSVQARVRALPFADRADVMTRVIAALDTFLDPLRGGPRGLGWPFGRDVYRSEILEQIDRVPGVDHVLELRLTADAGDPRCGNLALCPTWLVTPGEHQIDVEGAVS